MTPPGPQVHHLHLRLLRHADLLRDGAGRPPSLLRRPVPAERMDAFVADFSAYRLDEVLGPWKPYKDVVANALTRTCKANGVAYRDSDADAVYGAVPTWARIRTWSRAGQGRQGIPPGDPVELDEGADPAFGRQARRAVPCRLHGGRGPGLQAAHAGLPSTCSTSSAAAPRTCCTARRASATT